MRLGKFLISALTLGTVLTIAQIAGAQVTINNGSRAGITPKALGGATCGKARLCAFIGQGGTVFRSKNVALVTNPSAGVYCITPNAGVLNIATIVPSVTVEWGTSSGSDLLAFWRDGVFSCPFGAIEVRTYNLAGDLNPSVSFTIVVN